MRVAPSAASATCNCASRSISIRSSAQGPRRGAALPSCGRSPIRAPGTKRPRSVLSARDGGACAPSSDASRHPDLHFTRQRIGRDEKMLRKLDRIVMTPTAPLLQCLPSRRFGEERNRGDANATSTLQEQRSGVRPKSDRGVQGGAASDLSRRRWSPRSSCPSEQTW
jgi:hypothetical protein